MLGSVGETFVLRYPMGVGILGKIQVSGSKELGARSRGRYPVIALLVLLLITLLPTPAQAVEVKLQISPVPITLQTTPGKSIQTELRVRNIGSASEPLRISLYKFGAEGEEGRATLLERGPADSYFDWVSFSRTYFEAPPNEWQRVQMTIRPPKEAAFGYYYAVRIEPANQPVAKRGQAVQGAVVIFVLLNVEVPGAKRQAEVVELESEHRFYEFLPSKLRDRK